MNAHPIRLTIGSLVIAGELARKKGDNSLVIILRDSEGFARECRVMFGEIADTAELIRARNVEQIERIREFSKDGIFTQEEAEKLIDWELTDVEDAEHILEQSLEEKGAA